IMNDILKLWNEYWTGQSEIDYSIFYTMLIEEPTETDIVKAFDVIPEYSEFIKERVLEIIFPEKHFKEDNLKCSSTNLLMLVKLDIENIINLFKKFGEKSGVDTLSKLKYRRLDNIELIKEIKYNNPFHSEIIVTLGDCIIDSDKKIEFGFEGLHEALYGLTNNFQVIYHIMSELLLEEYDFSNYYKLWMNGGDYVITNDSILYAI
ncbi:MAG: hypothetical protein P1U56_16570, partial [Saprospiraceae bacterium]|nr:hypothetical protein [Saprospiraceae bacterium]